MNEIEQIDLEVLNNDIGTETSTVTINQGATTSEYVASELDTPHLITQADFNDLVRDSQMSQRSAEIVGSRLQQWKLVAPDFRVTAARKRGIAGDFDKYFSFHQKTEITYCNNIDLLFECFGQPHVPGEWRLFIDASVQSLKGVLLHIGNAYPSIPIIYGTGIKENYDTMKTIRDLTKFDEHGWKICCDLKVVAILMGIKQGFSKHQCFLCVWEGRKKEFHYTDYEWEQRNSENSIVGEHSIVFEPLARSEKIILPPLHIKIGLMRNFVRALNRESEAFKSLKSFFPKLSDAKIDAGVYMYFWK